MGPSTLESSVERKVTTSYAQIVLQPVVKILDFVAGAALLVLTWHLITVAINNPVLFPTPAMILRTGWQMAMQGAIWKDVATSLGRIAVGFVLGVSIGLIVGTVLGQIRILDRFLSPVIGFIRMLPPVALVPLAIIWFGIGESSKYFIVMWGTIIAVLFSTIDGLQSTPRNRVLAARCMGASRLRVIWDVVLPSAVPSIWTGMKLSIGLAISSVVSAELIAANRGIGFAIMRARVLIEVDQMFVGLATLALVGGVIDRLFKALGERLLHRYLAYVRG